MVCARGVVGWGRSEGELRGRVEGLGRDADTERQRSVWSMVREGH